MFVLGGTNSDDGKVKRISEVLNSANWRTESAGGDVPGAVFTLFPMMVSLKATVLLSPSVMPAILTLLVL